MKEKEITNIGQLKKSGYQAQSIQKELAKNLKLKLQKGEQTFEGIIGYENTVIPDVERALL